MVTSIGVLKKLAAVQNPDDVPITNLLVAAKKILTAVKNSLKKQPERIKYHHDIMIEPFGKKLSFTAEIQLDLDLWAWKAMVYNKWWIRYLY